MEKFRIVAYFPEWSVKEEFLSYSIESIPWDKITHLNYAFFQIKNGRAFPTEEDLFKENIKVINKFKKDFDVKVHISIGGWTLSGEFSDVALTEESRKTFAKSCLEIIQEYNLDGIDIDWEFPVSGGLPTNKYRPEDKENFTLLLKTIREVFENYGKKNYLLSCAVPAGYLQIQNTEPDKYHPFVDFINLMTYDFHGSWDKYTNHHSPLYGNPMDPDPISREKLNCDFAVKEYLRYGVPSKKVNLGIPFYGRGWITKNEGYNGLFAEVKDIPEGIFDEDKPSGYNQFFFIKGVLEKDPEFKKFWDEHAKVPWLWNPKKMIMFSYDDEKSILEKCNYLKALNLGGIMFWEITGDYPFKGDTLVTLIYNSLRGEK
ncbi:MAG: chitinase [Dictyoglomus sp. NZ13-RE01]|nr:MAG: chitinase [Dictyoglomus sp. NZ13-RE01]